MKNDRKVLDELIRSSLINHPSTSLVNSHILPAISHLIINLIVENEQIVLKVIESSKKPPKKPNRFKLKIKKPK